MAVLVSGSFTLSYFFYCTGGEHGKAMFTEIAGDRKKFTGQGANSGKGGKNNSCSYTHTHTLIYIQVEHDVHTADSKKADESHAGTVGVCVCRRGRWTDAWRRQRIALC